LQEGLTAATTGGEGAGKAQAIGRHAIAAGGFEHDTSGQTLGLN